MRRILHISNDDKYIALGKRIFDQVPEVENTFWIIPGANHTIQNVSFAHENLAHKNLNSSYYLDQINSFDLICIHFLNTQIYPVLKSKKINKPLLWIGWGGDYYWLMNTSADFSLFLPNTHKWIRKMPPLPWVDTVIKQLLKIKRLPKLQAVNQIDYFAPIYRAEYDAVKKNYPGFQPEFTEWNYGYIDQEVIDYYTPLHRYGKAVMIGNSATPTNNHLDILEKLRPLLQDKEIILPLNYGDNVYKNFIAETARQQFGNRAEILDEMMSSAEFDKKLLTCQHLIIGSLRQQAVGTIITALYLGLNVFLNKDSFNYAFFKEKDFGVFSTDELTANPQLLDFTPAPEKIKEHREKINWCWSAKKNAQHINDLLNRLTLT